MNQPLVVLKFGSSVLTDHSRLPAAVHEIYRYYRGGYQVLAVVSAIGRHTDLLLDEARHITALPAPDIATATLLATGEQQSAALLTMALHRAGVPSGLVDATSIALVLRGDRLDATPAIIDVDTVRSELSATPVLVLPGFVGRYEWGGTALMGRGGSDLTAVFLAEQLGAKKCRLLKDVDGIYERDPAMDAAEDDDGGPHRYASVSYQEALRVSRVLVQAKAVEYLQANSGTARVSALLREDGTDIGEAPSSTGDTTVISPLKVLLLGLGNVGQGVYQHLKQLSEFFEVVGINVRDVYKDRGIEVPRSLLERNIVELVARSHDVVVDVSGDRVSAYAAIDACLQAGCAAVTASKRLVAERGAALMAMAKKAGTSFKYSAAVGGSAPMVEAVQRAAELGNIIRLRGVLNGTCNYVLDRFTKGTPFEDAVVEAQELGLAESDVARDLSGQDTEDKLRILARIAFGTEHDGLPIWREGLQAVTRREIELARTRGQLIRLVATYEAKGRASVAPVALPSGDFLARTQAEENRLIINGAGGQVWQVRGKGAGRWPTAEAVIADMLDIHAEALRCSVPSPLPAMIPGLATERLAPL